MGKLVHQAFGLFDCVGDGYITHTELREGLSKLGVTSSTETITATTGEQQTDEEQQKISYFISEASSSRGSDDGQEHSCQQSEQSVSLSDFEAIMVKLGVFANYDARTDEECRELFNKIDVDR